jgi:hypothetical protein
VRKDMRRFTIYCHTCTTTGKKYVGQTTVGMLGRWRGHVVAALAGSTQCRVFWNAIRKHGPDAWTHEILDEVTSQEDANVAERTWIEKLDCRAPNGYNIKAGGSAGPVHPETRQKQSAIAVARWAALTPEARRAVMRSRIPVASIVAAQARRTREERAAASIKGFAGRTPAEISASARKRSARMSSHERSRLATVWHASLSSDERAWLLTKQRDGIARMTAEEQAIMVARQRASYDPERRTMAAVRREVALVASGRRSEISRSMWAAMTSERREEVRQHLSAGQLARSREVRSETAKLAQSKLTPEQRSARVVKGWETRRRNEQAVNFARLVAEIAATPTPGPLGYGC